MRENLSEVPPVTKENPYEEMSRLKKTGAIPQDIMSQIDQTNPFAGVYIMLARQNEDNDRKHAENREILKEVLEAQKHTNGSVTTVQAEIAVIKERHQKEDEGTLNKLIVENATKNMWLIRKISFREIAMLVIPTLIFLGGCVGTVASACYWVSLHWKP